MSTITDMLQEQMAREARASWVYRSLAEWASAESYDGTEKWLRHSADEELEHMHKIGSFLNCFCDITPSLPAVAAQAIDVVSLPDCFDRVLALELEVTNYINELAQAACSAGDMIVHNFLQWFLDEQIASVSAVRDIVRLVEKCNDQAAYLLADEKIGELVG